MLSLRSIRCYGNHVNANASDATIFVRFENARFKFKYTRNVLNARLFDSPCQPEIYLPREMKIQPDLSLVRDESSVRLVIAKTTSQKIIS